MFYYVYYITMEDCEHVCVGMLRRLKNRNKREENFYFQVEKKTGLAQVTLKPNR